MSQELYRGYTSLPFTQGGARHEARRGACSFAATRRAGRIVGNAQWVGVGRGGSGAVRPGARRGPHGGGVACPTADAGYGGHPFSKFPQKWFGSHSPLGCVGWGKVGVSPVPCEIFPKNALFPRWAPPVSDCAKRHKIGYPLCAEKFSMRGISVVPPSRLG